MDSISGEPTLTPDEITGLYASHVAKTPGGSGCDISGYRRSLEALRPRVKERAWLYFRDNFIWMLPTLILLGLVLLELVVH